MKNMGNGNDLKQGTFDPKFVENDCENTALEGPSNHGNLKSLSVLVTVQWEYIRKLFIELQNIWTPPNSTTCLSHTKEHPRMKNQKNVWVCAFMFGWGSHTAES